MGWQRTDDLDGSPAQQCTFGLDGKAYLIDLGDANAARLLKALQPFITVAQIYGELPVPPIVAGPIEATTILSDPPPAPAPPPPSAPARTTKRGRGKASTAVAQATIRQWANANGYQVSSKGRIPDVVMNEYLRRDPLTVEGPTPGGGWRAFGMSPALVASCRTGGGRS